MKNYLFNLNQQTMTIIFTIQDILDISQNQINANSDLFTKGLSEEDAKQLLQSIESTIKQEASDMIHELVYDDLMVINDHN